MKERVSNFHILRRRENTALRIEDQVVCEEPLEIGLKFGPEHNRQNYTLSITMRTPGDDQDLARGFLLTEGIIGNSDDITRFTSSELTDGNAIIAHLKPDTAFHPEDQTRHFYTSSSCGVCGKASIDMVRQVTPYRLIPGKPVLSENILRGLSSQMRSEQSVFQQTGGIHAAALFDMDGKLLQSREDVGRHNAVDKLIGWAANAGLLPLSGVVMVVSGRAGFELVQKASMAGVAIFVAVGAPSSLAVELAEESDMTLVGFLRPVGFNIYTHPQRIKLEE